MITPELFFKTLAEHGITFYTGVPDSLLKNLCAYITDHSNRKSHVIAANEGNAVGLAAGYHLATGKIPVVYMQNSGLGNTVNPLLSLTDPDVYNIPLLLIVGWRGEPGVHDEPQHVKQGKLTLPLLKTMGIINELLVDDEAALPTQINRIVSHAKSTNGPVALVVRKDTFAEYKLHNIKESPCRLTRELAIRLVASALNEKDVVVSTTGKISRELFEYREAESVSHERDFLTVGSMGHASQIALGIALNAPSRRVFCFDGDGAAIMHMGGMGIIGSIAPNNYYHVLFNNGVHDSVGGQPTVGFEIDFGKIATACGYRTVLRADDEQSVLKAMADLFSRSAPAFLEIRVKKGARKDLGRPTTTPIENKNGLMKFLNDVMVNG